jgi:hypothetical protein
MIDPSMASDRPVGEQETMSGTGIGFSAVSTTRLDRVTDEARGPAGPTGPRPTGLLVNRR